MKAAGCKVVIKKGPTTSTMVKNQLSEAQKAAKPAPSLGTHLSAEPMIAIWRSVVPKCCDTVKFVGNFTQAEKSMLKKLTVAWGKEALQVAEYILSNWVPYTQFVEEQAGIKKTPLAPAVPFLLKWGDEAVNFYHLHSEPVKKVAPVQLIAQAPKGKIIISKKSDKVATKELSEPTKVIPDGEEIASLEDILAIMKQ